MFGIAVANIEGLTEEEQQRYKAVYCGVCHALRTRYGQLSRASLTYDLAFLAILLDSLYEPPEERRSGWCAIHPKRRHEYTQGGFVDYAADMTVALSFHKCLDDWNDDGSVPSFAYDLLLLRPYRKVRALHPDQCRVIERSLACISAIEREAMERCARADSLQERREAFSRADEAARHFGAIMASLFSARPSAWSEELAAFGMDFGRFVYFMDAAIDRREDEKQGAYNPFVYAERSDEEISALLFSLIGSATAAFEKLPLEQDLHLMRSVLYSGVWHKICAQREKLAQQEQKHLQQEEKRAQRSKHE